MKSTGYRPDIDGLRALAVFCVIFFHLDFSAFPGGFIGVDVFFVISGFLITRLIYADALQGRFSLREFYLRRVRRILPALYFTYAITLFFSLLLLTPVHFKEYAKELVSSLAFISNMHFWKQAGYFDTQSITKPLLHTWSLSVEEQFYLLWPLALCALLRRKGLVAVQALLLCVAAASLVLNQVFAGHKMVLFYLIPFRLYEFCIGAAMVWLVAKQPAKGWVHEPLLLLGLAMIAYAALSYSKDMAFPGAHALVPCLGAALVIYSGHARRAGLLLRNRLCVGIGLISYSLYLIHWPAIVFYKYYRFEDITLAESWLLVVFSLAAAAAMYRWVEQPFRRGWMVKHLTASEYARLFLYTTLLFAVAGAAVWVTQGLGSRLKFARGAPLSQEYRDAMRQERCIGGFGNCDRDSAAAAPDIAIIGDSHSARMRYLIGTVAAQHRMTMETNTILCLGVYRAGADCDLPQMDAAFESIMKRRVPHVILVSSWNPMTQSFPPDLIVSRLVATIRHLQAHGSRVYVTGSMPYMNRDPALCYQSPLIAHDCAGRVHAVDLDSQIRFNRRLRDAVVSSGAKYLDFFQILCTDTHCLSEYEGMSLYGDRMHFDEMAIGGVVRLAYRGAGNLTLDRLFSPGVANSLVQASAAMPAAHE